jgi:hypothetical protein
VPPQDVPDQRLPAREVLLAKVDRFYVGQRVRVGDYIIHKRECGSKLGASANRQQRFGRIRERHDDGCRGVRMLA